MVSEEQLIEDLQEFADTMEQTPTTREMNSEGPWSKKTYEKYFGCWNNALEEAGLGANTPPSDEEIIEDLQEFADTLGRTPTAKEMNREGPWSRTTYSRHFGSWNNALEEAELEVNTPPSNEKLIEDLQEFADTLGRTPTMREMNSEGPWSRSTYSNNFGSWNNALKEAGLELNIPPSDEEQLVEDLQEFADTLGRTPTSREMSREGPWSDKTYSDHFGSWNNSLRKAGLEVNTPPSNEEMIEDLQEFADTLGRTPTSKEMNREGPWCRKTYNKYFGSWNNALKEAGLEVMHMGSNERAGKGKDPYGKGYAEVRRKCLNRDNYNCRACGKRSNLHCHHIMPRREFDDVSESNTLNNVITLCSSCHRRFEGLWTEADPDTFAANAQSYFES